MTQFSSRKIPLPLLIGTGSVIFLANAGLLVLQLVAGRFLAPFIGSSVETWTSIIGVFLTGIALGNWLGGRLADRFPSPRTVAFLLILSGLSSLGMIACYEATLASRFYTSIPLGPRIPLLAFLFCLVPALLLSLLTPVTIKLLLPDIGSAGRIAGLIFSLSTLGCLLGNYATGFWLMAYLTLNTITMIVGLGLIVLAIPVFLYSRATSSTPVPPNDTVGIAEPAAKLVDGAWDFRHDKRLAYVVVFVASFCGMSLELTGVRVLAPILGVSLFTWTGIIGVMLAGTASGNFLGGILADRGVGPAVRRFALLVGALLGGALATMLARKAGVDCNKPGDEWLEFPIRLAGAVAGICCVIPGIFLSKRRQGTYVIAVVTGGLLGTLLAHTVARAIAQVLNKREMFTDLFDYLLTTQGGAWIVHILGFAVGGTIALLFFWDAPKREERVTRSGALSGSLFLGGLTTLAILMLTGVFQPYGFMNPFDIVDKVLVWTFGLFFLPMLLFGTISPQVIRLSVPDMGSAGRIAGNIYAWSTTGAIVGTFATGYYMISAVGTSRVLMIIAFVLTLLAFFIGRLWKNNSMLYAASIVCGGAIFGLYLIGFGSNRYDLETKYYAIRVTPSPRFGADAVALSLDHLTHSFLRLNDPTWLGYNHEYVQGELLRLARSRNQQTNLLVIGGGGYTFPRYVETLMPDVDINVVEIDPGVTEIAHAKLGLSRDTSIHSFHMDGRQYVSERAPKHHYQLVVQDAVNDLSVPYHLMTKEYNEAIKQTLTADGAYLLTFIDSLKTGKLWRAAVNTMRESFPYVYLLSPDDFFNSEGNIRAGRHVYVIYGSDRPLDMVALQAVVRDYRLSKVNQDAAYLALLGPQVAYALPDQFTSLQDMYTTVLDNATLDALLNEQKKILLTDQYCPVDNLMSDVFRDRER